MNTDITVLTAKHVHLTGIKGVGMTAVALCVQDNGGEVTGSDVAHEFVTDKTLAKRNIIPRVDFKPENIPSNTELVVYTGAHQGINNPEVVWALENDIPSISLAEATGQLMENKIGISVCGVGGKTTTSAILATIFEDAGKNPSFLVGVASISSLPFPGKYQKESLHFIAEADEYASSPGIDNTPRFMYQTPQTIVCTNINHDHPDIYPDLKSTLNAYRAFFAKLPPDGLLIYNSDCPNTAQIINEAPGKHVSVGSSSESRYRLLDVKVENGQSFVTYSHHEKNHTFVLEIPGEYNARNALMAFACSQEHGIGREQINPSIMKFHGVDRRFQLIGSRGGAFFYDDYAHHPSEIVETLKAAKKWFPGKRIIAIFQPHTYSRTKALLSDFAKSFTYADKVLITDIFTSAREKKDPTISSELLVSKIAEFHPDVQLIKKDDLVEYINQIINSEDVLFTIGAGDVYEFHHNYFQKHA